MICPHAEKGGQQAASLAGWGGGEAERGREGGRAGGSLFSLRGLCHRVAGHVVFVVCFGECFTESQHPPATNTNSHTENALPPEAGPPTPHQGVAASKSPSPQPSGFSSSPDNPHRAQSCRPRAHLLATPGCPLALARVPSCKTRPPTQHHSQLSRQADHPHTVSGLTLR